MNIYDRKKSNFKLLSFYHHADHLVGGNIDLDENGAILQVVDYYPFGEVRNSYNSSKYKNKYKFGGKERDTESGLDYFEARYYSNNNGRFNSIDRVFWSMSNEFLLNPQLQNSYSYVGNNPLKYIDPTGTKKQGKLKKIFFL